jgi:hypothetical protein
MNYYSPVTPHTIENSEGLLTNLLEKIKREEAAKEDIVCDTRNLGIATRPVEYGDMVGDSERRTMLVLDETGAPTQLIPISRYAHDQLAQKVGIDVRTLRRLQSDYTAQHDNLLKAIFDQEPKRVLLRTMLWDDDVEVLANRHSRRHLRAILSDKFKTFDNVDLLDAVSKTVQNSDAKWKIQKCLHNDRRLVLQFKSETITGEGANVGDLMAHGLNISNSEVGCGSVVVSDVYWTLACLNGMQGMNKSRSAHLTSSRADAETYAILSQKAKDLDNAALKAKLADWVKEIAKPESFERTCRLMREAASQTVVDQLGAVQELGNILRLSKPETKSVLDGLMSTIQQPGYVGEPVSKATLANAVTSAANHAEADKVENWQKLGGQVLNLPNNQWQAVATAEAMAA